MDNFVCFVNPAACAERAIEDETFPPEANDEFMHCVLSCKIAGGCGAATAAATGIGKELQDIVGPGHVEASDLDADLGGIACHASVPDMDCRQCCSLTGYP
jgi:hypothetical protein